MSDPTTHDESAENQGAEPASSALNTPAPVGLKRKKKKEKKKYDTLNQYLWHEWIKPLGLILLILGSFRAALLDWNDVPSGSMEPSVLTGDRIGVNKSAFGTHVPFTKDKWLFERWGQPNRGEIVVAYSPDPNDPVRIVKRVVGVPGDRVEVRNGRLVLNGEAVEYRELEGNEAARYLKPSVRTRGEFYEEVLPASDPDDADGFRSHAVMFWPDQPQYRNMPEIVLGEDEYFFMGDNRDQSKDSRVYGIVPGKRIVGRAVGVAFSLNHDKFYLPRITRFFSGLK